MLKSCLRINGVIQTILSLLSYVLVVALVSQALISALKFAAERNAAEIDRSKDIQLSIHRLNDCNLMF